MRAKTNYAEKPERLEILNGDKGQFVVCFRENIAEIEGEDGGKTYTADEYIMVLPVSQSLKKRIEENFDAWMKKAKQDDYNAVAAEVRVEREKLLTATDYILLADYPISAEERQAWQAYRQALRDITDQAGFPYDVTFPEKPNR